MDKPRWTLLLAPLFICCSPTLQAQEKPLRWGIDDEGGVPYYFSARTILMFASALKSI